MKKINFELSTHVQEELAKRKIPLPLLTGGETMKLTYDPEVDVLRIVFRDIAIEESDEEKPGMILDYDKDGNIVGMEILDASKRVENPRSVEYAVAG
jgi:uncharacterized protein YuzE